jgi:desulfoferrodoxin (superoxide reductase-like protein)
MKRTIIISNLIFGVLLLALTIFCFSPQTSYADAPKDVKIVYDSNAQTLAVTITHKSPFPGFHHIKTVEIKKNAAVVSTTNYDTQPKDVPFIYTYKVKAVTGDKLEATATCNISGSKTATITVSGTNK